MASISDALGARLMGGGLRTGLAGVADLAAFAARGLARVAVVGVKAAATFAQFATPRLLVAMGKGIPASLRLIAAGFDQIPRAFIGTTTKVSGLLTSVWPKMFMRAGASISSALFRTLPQAFANLAGQMPSKKQFFAPLTGMAKAGSFLRRLGIEMALLNTTGSRTVQMLSRGFIGAGNSLNRFVSVWQRFGPGRGLQLASDAVRRFGMRLTILNTTGNHALGVLQSGAFSLARGITSLSSPLTLLKRTPAALVSISQAMANLSPFVRKGVLAIKGIPEAFRILSPVAQSTLAAVRGQLAGFAKTGITSLTSLGNKGLNFVSARLFQLGARFSILNTTGNAALSAMARASFAASDAVANLPQTLKRIGPSVLGGLRSIPAALGFIAKAVQHPTAALRLLRIAAISTGTSIANRMRAAANVIGALPAVARMAGQAIQAQFLRAAAVVSGFAQAPRQAAISLFQYARTAILAARNSGVMNTMLAVSRAAFRSVGGTAMFAVGGLLRFAGKGIARVTNAIRNLSSGLVSGVGLIGAYVGAFTLIKMAKNVEGFNRAMNRSLAIMQDVTPQLRHEMEEMAFTVASATTKTSKEAAEAYFFLASAGLDAAQSLKAMSTVAQFAHAGQFDMALATDLLTDAQSALGLTVKDATQNMLNMTRVGDVLVKANTLANATTEQFSKALTTKAGPALKGARKSMEEGVAILAAFADQGVKAEEAGTGLNIVLRDLQTKAIKNADAWKQMGISAFDANDNLLHISDVLAQLEGRLDNASDKQRKMTLLQLGFTDKSVIFIQSLLGMSERIREFHEELKVAEGTMKDVGDKQMTPFEAAINKLAAAWDKFTVRIGTPVMAAFGAGIEAVLPQLEAFFGMLQQDFTQSFKAEAIVDKLKGIGRSLATVADVGRGLVLVWKAIKIVGLGVLSIISFGIAAMTKGLEEGINAIIRASNEFKENHPTLGKLLPDMKEISIGGDFAVDVFENLKGDLSKEWEEAMKLLDEPLPSKRLEEFEKTFESLQDKVKKEAARIEKERMEMPVAAPKPTQAQIFASIHDRFQKDMEESTKQFTLKQQLREFSRLENAAIDLQNRLSHNPQTDLMAGLMDLDRLAEQSGIDLDPQINALIKAKEASDGVLGFEEQTKALQNLRGMFGRFRGQLERDPDSFFESVKRFDLQEQLAEVDKLRSFVDGVKEDLKSKPEKFADELKKLEDAALVGLLTPQQVELAAKEKLKDLFGDAAEETVVRSTDQSGKLAEAVDRFDANVLSEIFRATRPGEDSQRKMVQEQVKTKEEMKKANATLEKTLAALKNMEPVGTTAIP